MYAKFHNDRLRNGWDITLWNFAKTRTNKHTNKQTHKQTNTQTDMGITIPRPPPMGGEVIMWSSLGHAFYNQCQHHWTNCIPHTNVYYALVVTPQTLTNNFIRISWIASIFYMYIDIGDRIAGKQDCPSLIIEWSQCFIIVLQKC